MHPKTRTTIHLRRAALAVLAFPMACTAAGSLSPTKAAAPPVATLQDLFNAAWARQPEALALADHQEAAQAQRRAAQAWTPEPPALEASHKTDRVTRNHGAREFDIGLTVPLWLPGERRISNALADAQAAVVESRTAAARLRLAAAVREAWWTWQRASLEAEVARGQLDSTRRVADDVAHRARAGELARADQHQADGAVAAARAGLAQAEAAAAAALQQVQSLAGRPLAVPRPTAMAAAEPEPAIDTDTKVHAALAELQDLSTLAGHAAALVATQTRANPELTVAATRDRGATGDRYGQTLTLALRIPFGSGPRHDSRLANARAEAAEAQARLVLDRARVQAEQEAARVRVGAARAQLAAARHRATLAREARGFFDKSFRLGETDLPTRLRIENEATEADRQAARSHIELAAALSAWRQALGLLPQ